MTLGRSPWWNAQIHADRRGFLTARGKIKQAARAYFEARQFTEVECGALQISPGNEAHLHAMATEIRTPDGTPARVYLHTSPEFASKKLLAAGERRIFDFARVFRNRERGPLHAPEFTMLEWYRVEETYDAIIDDCLALIRLAADTTGTKAFTFRNRTCDPRAAAERITVGDAFRKHAGIDLLATIKAGGDTDAEALRAACTRAGIKTDLNDNWSDMFSRVLVEKVEPHLGSGRVTVLDQYPRAEAALARACANDARVAERFEIYACGVELANGFGELTDPAEQRKRFEAEMAEKQRVYGERYPIDEDFLAALAHMPPASGVALGFDRLVMLAAGANRIDQVVWTPAPGGDS